MTRNILYLLTAYLSGSILYARIWGRLLCHKDITAGVEDQNPGTTNAFKEGSMLCGILTLLCDLTKGFLPVWLYTKNTGQPDILLALMLAAPVAGHIFPVFYHFRGGKGIAVSFGCLLGLFPYYTPVLLLAGSFIFFSIILVITPHWHRTLASYGVAMLLILFCIPDLYICLGMLMITILICIKLLSSKEEKEIGKVKLL